MSVLYADDQGPYFWFFRGNFTGTNRVARPTGIPGLTDEQADALDAVQFAASKHAVRIPPKKGSMYFINNLDVMHSRTAFQDDRSCDEIPRRRHLTRIWLRDPKRGRKVAVPLQKRWNAVFDPESTKDGRWLLTRQMEPNVISEKLFKQTFLEESFNSCQNN